MLSFPAYSSSQPLICQLPKELQDEVISDIESHRDLISLALSCRSLKVIVVPRHSDYRILRTRDTLPFVWAHLARRKDLTKNIRHVSICEIGDRRSTDRWPKQLLDKLKDEKPQFASESTRMKHICEALRHMDNLTSFSWSCRPPECSPHEDAILEILSQKKTLKHLALEGDFARHARGQHHDPESDVYPLWRISNLQSLSLRGYSWMKPSNMVHICKMLERSPDLESLQLPMEFQGYCSIRLDNLKRLNIPLIAGARPAIDVERAKFIERHPSIEELSWSPLSHETRLGAGSLPNLRSVKTHEWIMNSLLSGPTKVKMERAYFSCLDPQTLACLERIEPQSVRALSFGYFDNVSSVIRLSKMFPYLNWLHVGNHDDSMPVIPLQIWLEILGNLPFLEVFRGNVIWKAVNGNMDEMHLAIAQVVQRCPKVRLLDHCNRHRTRRHDVQRIRIIREERPEGLHVRYAIERPPPRSELDIMGGLFD